MADDIDWSGGETNNPPPTTKKKLTPEDPAYWLRHTSTAAALIVASPTGRPTKFQPVRLARLLASVASGNTYEGACNLVSTTYRSFATWQERGRNKEAGFVQFLHLLRKAEGYAEHKAIKDIRRDHDWKSKAWWLERRYKDRWAKYSRVAMEHSGTVNHTHRLNSSVHIEDPQAYLSRLSAMLSRPQLPDDQAVDAEYHELTDSQPQDDQTD